MNNKLSLDKLRKANFARQQEWDSGNLITLEYRGNEFAGEAGEACNVIKKLARERLGIRGSRDTVEHLAEELADVIICADLIAMSVGVDLGDAIAYKFNKTSEANGLKERITFAPDIPKAQDGQLVCPYSNCGGRLVEWKCGTCGRSHNSSRREAMPKSKAEQLCEDEGCPHHGTPHVCITKPDDIPKEPSK